MARHIPRKLLCHSVTHKWESVKDDWGNETWAKSRNIARVRVEPASKLVQTKDNKEIQLALLMFYDPRNSAPQGAAFGLGECITWMGEDYTIVNIDRLYDFNRLHHLEIGLV